MITVAAFVLLDI